MRASRNCVIGRTRFAKSGRSSRWETVAAFSSGERHIFRGSSGQPQGLDIIIGAIRDIRQAQQKVRGDVKDVRNAHQDFAGELVGLSAHEAVEGALRSADGLRRRRLRRAALTSLCSCPADRRGSGQIRMRRVGFPTLSTYLYFPHDGKNPATALAFSPRNANPPVCPYRLGIHLSSSPMSAHQHLAIGEETCHAQKQAVSQASTAPAKGLGTQKGIIHSQPVEASARKGE